MSDPMAHLAEWLRRNWQAIESGYPISNERVLKLAQIARALATDNKSSFEAMKILSAEISLLKSQIAERDAILDDFREECRRHDASASYLTNPKVIDAYQALKAKE